MDWSSQPGLSMNARALRPSVARVQTALENMMEIAVGLWQYPRLIYFFIKSVRRLGGATIAASIIVSRRTK